MVPKQHCGGKILGTYLWVQCFRGWPYVAFGRILPFLATRLSALAADTASIIENETTRIFISYLSETTLHFFFFFLQGGGGNVYWADLLVISSSKPQVLGRQSQAANSVDHSKIRPAARALVGGGRDHMQNQTTNVPAPQFGAATWARLRELCWVRRGRKQWLVLVLTALMSPLPPFVTHLRAVQYSSRDSLAQPGLCLGERCVTQLVHPPSHSKSVPLFAIPSVFGSYISANNRLCILKHHTPPSSLSTSRVGSGWSGDGHFFSGKSPD